MAFNMIPADRFTLVLLASLLPESRGFAKRDITACPTRLTRLRPRGTSRRERRIDVTGVSLLFPSVNFLIARDFATRHVASSQFVYRKILRFWNIFPSSIVYFYFLRRFQVHIHFARNREVKAGHYRFPRSDVEGVLWRDYRSHDISRSNTLLT